MRLIIIFYSSSNSYLCCDTKKSIYVIKIQFVYVCLFYMLLSIISPYSLDFVHTVLIVLMSLLFFINVKIFLKTCDNQFGFKRKHSTEFCIYTLKEFSDYYKQRGTTIFVTFLDASKAFDKLIFGYYFKN